MGKTKQQPIGFSDIFDDVFLEKVYSAFKEHILKEPSKLFINYLLSDIFVGLDKENAIKVLKNLDINLNGTGVCEFLENNCYVYLIPKMYEEGHKFSPMEKTYLAGYSFFVEGLVESDYPHRSPCEQTKEFVENKISEAFIDSVFTMNITNMVKTYHQYKKDNGM